MKTNKFIILVLIAFVSFSMQGCNLLKKRVEKKEKVSYKLSAQNKVKISVSNTNGEIKVTRTSDTLPVITVDAEKIAKVKYDESDKPLTNPVIEIDSAGSEIKISSEKENFNIGLFSHGDNARVNYDIRVPANMSVAIDNVNGTVTLTNLAGTVKVETVNGATIINRCSGDITIDGTNGTVSGNLDSVKTLNVDVVNGKVRLGGLKNISAQVSASTVNGKVKFNNLSLSNMVSERKSLSGTLGTGKANVKITTVNGSVTLDGNDISIGKDRIEDFEFKIDFGDDDNTVVKKKENAKTLDTQKVPETPKASDSSKTK